MTVLIERKARHGEFRVIADSFGQWRMNDSDILVGDFDGSEQARDATKPAETRSPGFRQPRQPRSTIIASHNSMR